MSSTRRALLLVASLTIPSTGALAGFGLASPWRSASAQTADVASANIVNATGATVGQARFTQQGGLVRVEADVSGLPPGFHGFHVHTAGACDGATSFMTAGGHWNPTSANHADHAGDMPSLYVNGDGTAAMSLTIDRFSVAGLFDDDGSALIIHTDPDNLAHIPERYGVAPDETTLATGDAGGRIACGVVERTAGAIGVPDRRDGAHGAHRA